MGSTNTFVTVRYLYGTRGTSYLQLIIATCKAENESEEIWDNVRVRAMVMTDPGEGTAELGQQIAKLMAALTQAGQGNGPSSAPGSPRKGVMDDDTIVVVPPVAQTPTMVGVALDRQSQPTAYSLGMGLGALGMEAMARVTRGLVQGGRAWPVIRTQTLSNDLGVRVGPHGQGMPYTSISFKPVQGEPR